MDTTQTGTEVLIAPAGSDALSMMGVTIDFKVRGSHTGGQWALLEYVAPPGFRGPLPHYHKVLTETFHVVEGVLSLDLDGETVEAAAGTTVLVPPGAVHRFYNLGEQPVKFLVHFAPGGMEDYFTELFALVQSEETWPPADVSKVVALAERFDTYNPPVAG